MIYLKNFFMAAALLLLPLNMFAAEAQSVDVAALLKIITAKKSSKTETAQAMHQLKSAADQHQTEDEYWYAWMRFYGKGGKTFYIIRQSRI